MMQPTKGYSTLYHEWLVIRIDLLRMEAAKEEPDSGKWFRLNKAADELQAALDAYLRYKDSVEIDAYMRCLKLVENYVHEMMNSQVSAKTEKQVADFMLNFVFKISDLLLQDFEMLAKKK
jgi:hypothetical protein